VNGLSVKVVLLELEEPKVGWVSMAIEVEVADDMLRLPSECSARRPETISDSESSR